MGPLQIAEIAKRVRLLRLKRTELARLSKVDANCLAAALDGRSDPRLSTLAKLQTALVGAELETLRRLAAIYPQEAMEAATVALCPQRAEQQRSAA